MCTFHTKIYDLIQDYVHHGENQLCQEVEDDFIFLNIFVGGNLTIWPIILWYVIKQVHSSN